MSTKDHITVALIGCGGNGRGHLRRLKEIKGVELVGLADPSTKGRALAREAVDQPKLPGFRQHAKLLEKIQPDAVVISTPHSCHHQQIIDCLEAGCHVLCEKPLVCSSEEARSVIAKRDKSGLVVGIAYQRHLLPPYMYCRKVVAAGDIGKVHFVSCCQSQNWYMSQRGTWRQQQALACGGQLNDSGSHLLDIVLWMTGLRPQSAFAYIDNLDSEVDILTAMSVRCEGGPLCNFSVVGHSLNYVEDITIWGDQGTLAIRGSDVYLWRDPEKREKVPPRKMPAGSTPDENFIAAMRGQEEIATPPECGLPVIQLTEAAWRSAETGQPQSVGQ